MKYRIEGFFRTLVAVAVVHAGAEMVRAQVSSDSPVKLPDGTELAKVDFERHVAGLFGRLGCNSAACHGSFQGKGGFRLSLFGQSPAMDHSAVRSEGDEGRIDLTSPDDSLLLAKPSGRESHGGGIRLPPDSWEFRLIRHWIAEGARRTPGHGLVRKLIVDPVDIPPLAIGQKVAIRVFAEFDNGDREDVTAFSEFRSREDTIVEIDAAGRVVARAAGDTAVIASYRGAFLGVPVIVPFSSSQPLPASAATNNWIDEEVDARLKRLNLVSSPLTDDAEFLRRVTIDLIGVLPTPAEVSGFLADRDPHKRRARIDALLVHPRRAALWATKMCDITGCNVDQLGEPAEMQPKRAKMWHDWFRKRFDENTPYDRIVHGVLCASSRGDQPVERWIDDEIALETAARTVFETNYKDRPGLDYFWRRIGPQGPVPVEDLAELTATAFLGLRLHCARCHQHPYDHWTQADFAGYATIFSHAEFGSSTELRTAISDRLERRRKARQEGQILPEFPRIQEVFVNPIPRSLGDSSIAEPVLPKAPGGPVLTGDEDARETLFRWLKRSDNPYFAASFVNRIWAKFFGVGLVEPVDAFSQSNPATHPRLLERLAQEFVNSGYDIRHLERLIASSAAYQRSAKPAGNNATDQRSFAHARVRPLMAEVLIDSLNAALESTEKFGSDVPEGCQAIELAPNRFSDPNVNELFRILGRGDRKALCECGRAAGPSIRQPLYLMSDTTVVGKLRGGRLSRLLEQNATDAEIVNEFFLATLSRKPDADELDLALRHVSAGSTRLEGLADLVWALVNSHEFATNH